MSCLLPYLSPLIARLKLINGPIASSIARLCFSNGPCCPTWCSLNCFNYEIGTRKTRNEKNRIAHVKKASLAEWGKAGALNDFCALVHRVTYMQYLLRTRRCLETFQDHFITIYI